MMKQIVLLLLSATLTGCSDERTDVRAFIPGSYVRDIRTEFAIGRDSVVITLINGDHYAIAKYAAFSRIKAGVPQSLEVHEEKMAGDYDEIQQVIREFKKGKVFHFDPAKNTLFIGASAYRKVQ